MTTKVESSIEVDVPVSAAYNQWTQFEEFPEFMGGVSQVTQLDDKRLHWVAQIAGVKREWDAVILEQVPNEKVAWAATGGATNAGAVHFSSLGATRTSVSLSLEYEPEGIVEKAGDKLNIVQKQAEADLKKFKTYIESRGFESGGWRGTVGEGAGVGTPGVEHAAASKGDSGKAGVSGTTVAAGVAAVAAAGVAAVAASKSGSSEDKETVRPVSVTPTPVTPVTPVAAAPVTETSGRYAASSDDLTTSSDDLTTSSGDLTTSSDDLSTSANRPTTTPLLDDLDERGRPV